MEASVLNQYLENHEEVNFIGVPEALSDFELSKEVLSDMYVTEGMIPPTEVIGQVLIGFSAFIVEEGTFVSMGLVIVGETATARYNYRNGLVETIPNDTIDSCLYYSQLQVIVMSHSGDEFVFIPHVIQDGEEGYYFSSETSSNVTDKLTFAIPIFESTDIPFAHDDVYEELQHASAIHSRCVYVLQRIGVSDSEMSGSPRSLPSDAFLNLQKKNTQPIGSPLDEPSPGSYLVNYTFNVEVPESETGSNTSNLSLGGKRKTQPCGRNPRMSPIPLLDSESTSALSSPDSWSRRSVHRRSAWEMRTSNAIDLLQSTERDNSYKMATAAQWVESLSEIHEVAIVVTQYEVFCYSPAGDLLWKDRISDYNKIAKYSRHQELLKLSTGRVKQERLLLLLSFKPQLRALEQILSDARPMQVVTITDEQLEKLPEHSVIENLCSALEIVLFSQRDRIVSFAPPQVVDGVDDGKSEEGHAKIFLKENHPKKDGITVSDTDIVSSDDDYEEGIDVDDSWGLKRKKAATGLASLIKPASFTSIGSFERQMSSASDDLPMFSPTTTNRGGTFTGMFDVKAALEREEAQDQNSKIELDDSSISVLISGNDIESSKQALEKIIRENLPKAEPQKISELDNQLERVILESIETQQRADTTTDQYQDAMDIYVLFSSETGKLFSNAFNVVSPGPSSFPGSPLTVMSPGEEIDELNEMPHSPITQVVTIATSPITEESHPLVVAVDTACSPITFEQNNFPSESDQTAKIRSPVKLVAQTCSPILQLRQQFPKEREVEKVSRGSSPILFEDNTPVKAEVEMRSIGILAKIEPSKKHFGAQVSSSENKTPPVKEMKTASTNTDISLLDVSTVDQGSEIDGNTMSVQNSPTNTITSDAFMSQEYEALIANLNTVNSQLRLSISNLFEWCSTLLTNANIYYNDSNNFVFDTAGALLVELRSQIATLQIEINNNNEELSLKETSDVESEKSLVVSPTLRCVSLSGNSETNSLVNSKRLNKLRMTRERLEEDVETEKNRQLSVNELAPRDLEGHVSDPLPSKKLNLERTLNTLRQRRREIEHRLTANNILIDIPAKELTQGITNNAPAASPEPLPQYQPKS